MLVEQLQNSNAELARLALTDALTGLWNRRAILAEIPRLLALAQREALPAGGRGRPRRLQVDQRHPRPPGGDLFLAQVARNLQGSLRTSDMLGRTGGDEFVVVALGPRSEQLDLASEMLRAAEHLQQRLAKATLGHYDMGGEQERLDYAGASAGVVALLPNGIDAEEAIRRADREMYRIKQQRKRDTTPPATERRLRSDLRADMPAQHRQFDELRCLHGIGAQPGGGLALGRAGSCSRSSPRPGRRPARPRGPPRGHRSRRCGECLPSVSSFGWREKSRPVEVSRPSPCRRPKRLLSSYRRAVPCHANGTPWPLCRS